MDQETKKLVKNLTEFQEGSENFKRTLQFVQSNFRFHRYLDPDSHKITRTLNGIREKLLIHSKPEKACALERCVEKFLGNPLSEKAKLTKTEGHYAVLSLLLNLSHSPIHAAFQEREPERKPAPEPKFDWTGFLLEGLEPVRSFRDRESSEEEWSEEEEEVPVTDQPSTREGALQADPGTFSSTLYGAEWAELGESVVVQYWDGEQDPTLHSDHLTHHMTKHWSERELSSKPFLSDIPRTTMTETHIIRETIWMFLGAGKSFLYQMGQDGYVAREDVQVSHLTPVALHGITRQLANLGSKVLQLQAFIDRVQMHPMSYCCVPQKPQPTSLSSEKELESPKEPSNEDLVPSRLPSVTDSESGRSRSQSLPDILKDTGSPDPVQSSKPAFNCQTYEAFAEALAKVLHDFRSALVDEEKKVVAQDESYTLCMFKDWLSSTWVPSLHLAHTVYQQGIEGPSVQLSSHRAYSLLHVLHTTFKEHFCLVSKANKELDLLWHLWTVTTRPYISFITKWLRHGILSDPAQEFAIRRNREIHIRSESYWKKAFSLQTLPADDTDGALLSVPADRKKRERRSARKSMPSAVPEFLQPVLSHILLAGKSMEILEATGKLTRARQDELEELFQVTNPMIPTSSPTGTKSAGEKPVPGGLWSSSSAGDVAEMVDRQLSLRGFNDPLIACGISHVDPGPASRDGDDDVVKDQEMNANLSKPLELVLYRELYPGIVRRCQSICSQLAAVLKKDFSLQDHLLSLRRFFLLEAGDVMYDFYSEIFDKIRRCESWHDTLNLNYHLQETLSARYPDEAARILVSVEPERLTGKMSTKQPIHALDSLTLHYKVPWPVDIVIHHHSVDIYNQVFRFLLQVKRAQYCLQQLRFPDLLISVNIGHLNEDDDQEIFGRGQADETLREKLPLIHRLFILRFRLMHFVNAVHNYLMTRILYSTGLEFSAAVDEALDLDQILAAHKSYLAKVSERCLLHPKVSFVREAVSKVLNLAVTFQKRWDAGVHTFSTENVKKAEDEFSNCNKFLSSLLAKIIRRGTFPHLEALALSLSGPSLKNKSADIDQR